MCFFFCTEAERRLHQKRTEHGRYGSVSRWHYNLRKLNLCRILFAFTVAPRVIVTSAGTGVKTHRQQNIKQQTRTARTNNNKITTATITRQKEKINSSSSNKQVVVLIGNNSVSPVLHSSLYYSCLPQFVGETILVLIKKKKKKQTEQMFSHLSTSLL